MTYSDLRKPKAVVNGSPHRIGAIVLAAVSCAAALLIAPLPQDPVCNAPGLPPCAPPADPNVLCAIVAWRTFMPCNYLGVQVPQGTPGSWG